MSVYKSRKENEGGEKRQCSSLSQSRETEKYDHEFRKTRNQEWLRWRDPEVIYRNRSEGGMWSVMLSNEIQSQGHVTTADQSVSPSLARAPSGAHD
jgi:hypothetical protein